MGRTGVWVPAFAGMTVWVWQRRGISHAVRNFSKYELDKAYAGGTAVIAPLSRSRAMSSVAALSNSTLSILTIVALTLLVVGGLLLSILAPLIFAGVFSGIEVSASDLTPFMNGW